MTVLPTKFLGPAVNADIGIPPPADEFRDRLSLAPAQFERGWCAVMRASRDQNAKRHRPSGDRLSSTVLADTCRVPPKPPVGAFPCLRERASDASGREAVLNAWREFRYEMRPGHPQPCQPPFNTDHHRHALQPAKASCGVGVQARPQVSGRTSAPARVWQKH